ncbi:MAG: hypothetical protein RDV48_13655 [Candidatus Eremiobacteraeota bacterium]|nr:hypothetical protein [Candidatus Eremiobacteraeota bacterium]
MEGFRGSWFLAAICLSLIFLASFPSPCEGAARLSGTLVSADPGSGIYVLQLADGSKKKIKLQQSSSGGGKGGFATGQYVVASIVSPLNDDPLIADSLMDSNSARKSAPAAYTIPINTRVGGFASSGGPAATGGQNPYVIGNLVYGGGNLTPPAMVNAPFTASPAPMNSPYTGSVLTGQGGGVIPQGQSGGSTLNMMTGQTPMTASPTAINNPFSGQSVISGGGGAPPQANPGGMITGQKNYQATPGNMIHDQPQNRNSDFTGLSGNNTAQMMGGQPGEEDDDEDDDPMTSGNNDALNAMMPTPTQVNGKVMDINLNNGVIFYMLLGGSQDLGTAVLTQKTRIFDGQTKQPLSLQALPKGSIVVIQGYKRSGNCLEASAIMMMQRQ